MSMRASDYEQGRARGWSDGYADGLADGRRKLRKAVARLRIFADLRMKINEPPMDDDFNRGIRHAVDDLSAALDAAQTPQEPRATEAGQ